MIKDTKKILELAILTFQEKKTFSTKCKIGMTEKSGKTHRKE